MEVFGIIFYIIIFAVLASVKKAARSGDGDTVRKTMFHIPTKGKTPIPNVSNHEKVGLPNVLTKGKVSIPNVPSKGRTAIPNVPNKKRQTPIFMEPHKEEHYQPKIRTNNLWGEDEHAGKRIVALRLMEGDPVPEGYERIKCPYCAADNLVTKHCKQYHSCYFCRVPID